MTTFDELFAEHNLTPKERKALVMHLATLRAQKTVEALQDGPPASAPSTPPPAVVEAVPSLHPATADLVRRFSQALAEKLAAAEAKYGYSDGWASPDWMDECRAKLIEHIAKGDPRDVAAYCAFLWHHGASTAPAVVEAVPLTDEQIDSLRGLDTAGRVRFYEHDFYVLSNFSAFTLQWKGRRFDTSEAAYHWEKFADRDDEVQDMILEAPSAHEAFKIAESQRAMRRADWDAVKVGIMLDILRAKADQHEYVRRKLLATGDRELVEDSWRDDFWGWGPNRDGKNMLGRLWMQVRSELRGIAPKAAQP